MRALAVGASMVSEEINRVAGKGPHDNTVSVDAYDVVANDRVNDLGLARYIRTSI